MAMLDKARLTMIFLPRHPLRRTALAAAALFASAALPAAAAPLVDGRAVTADVPAFARSASLSGNYLAGRFAGSQRESEAAAEFYARALELDPDNEHILERAFLLEISSGNIRKASTLAVEVLKRDNNHRIAHVVLGIKHFRAGRYGRARAHFSTASQGAIGELTSSILIAWSYQAQNRTAEAVAALDVLAKTESFAVFRDYHAALIYDYAGDEDRAGEFYRAAYEEAGTSLRVVQAYGSFLERTGRPAEAMEIYKTFLENTPDHPLVLEAVAINEAGDVSPRPVDGPLAGVAEGLFGIASALTDESSIDGALIYVRLTLFAKSDLIIGQTLLGDIFEDTGRYEKAVEAYDEVPASSALRKNADIQIASNLAKLKRVDEARARFEKVIAEYPDDRRPVIALANMLRSLKEFEEAARFYEQAIEMSGEIEQRDWTLFYFRGICYERSKQWPKAEADFRQALELIPEQPLVLNYLGYSLVEKGLNLDEALTMIKKAVELRPNDGYIVDSLGWAYYQLGEYEKATELLERAVELRPEDPVINDHLGDAYWRVGRRLEARFQWSHAKVLDPEPEDLIEIEEKLKHGLEPEEMQKATSSTEVPPQPVR